MATADNDLGQADEMIKAGLRRAGAHRDVPAMFNANSGARRTTAGSRPPPRCSSTRGLRRLHRR